MSVSTAWHSEGIGTRGLYSAVLDLIVSGADLLVDTTDLDLMVESIYGAPIDPKYKQPVNVGADRPVIGLPTVPPYSQFHTPETIRWIAAADPSFHHHFAA